LTRDERLEALGGGKGRILFTFPGLSGVNEEGIKKRCEIEGVKTREKDKEERENLFRQASKECEVRKSSGWGASKGRGSKKGNLQLSLHIWGWTGPRTRTRIRSTHTVGQETGRGERAGVIRGKFRQTVEETTETAKRLHWL